MSIRGINHSLPPLPPPPQGPGATGAGTFAVPRGAGQVGTPGGIGPAPSQATPTSPRTPPASNPAPSGTQANGRAPQALSATAPPGTDPALWSVLSSDERTHFAKLGSMGPLTYGRMLTDMRTAQIPSARGGRLDVKV